MAMNTPGHDQADVVTRLMLQITKHAEQLAVLDQREVDHYRELTQRLDNLARQVAETVERVDAMHDLATTQAALLETLNGLDQQVGVLTTRLAQMAAATKRQAEDGTYAVVPTPRWWKLDGTERDEALIRLRAWVEQIYRPGYGHLAAALGPCWDQHPLCLYGLDWLMELWSALYLSPGREASTLASQAEWHVRLLPTLAEQLHHETARCEHGRLTRDARRPSIQNILNQAT
jgi:hypothetical protein